MMILEIVILLMVCISLAFNFVILKDINDDICHIKTDINVLFKKFSDYAYDDSMHTSYIRIKLDDIFAKIDSQENTKKENTKKENTKKENTKKEDPTKESNVIRFVPERLDCNEINSVVSIPYSVLKHVSEYDVKKAILDDLTAQLQNYILLESSSNPTMEEVLYRGKLRILGQPIQYDPYIFKDLKSVKANELWDINGDFVSYKED